MLRCKDLHEMSEEYLDGNLSSGKKLSITLHIMICRHCRRYLKQLHLTREVIHNNDGSNTSADEQSEITNIMKRIEEETKSSQ